MAKHIDTLLLLLVSFLYPIVGLLLFWWTSLIFWQDNRVGYAGITGIIIGCLVLIRQWTPLKQHIYRLRGWQLLIIYILYNFGMFGFFMGVPVFHFFLSIPIGLYWQRRWLTQKTKDMVVRKQQHFTLITIGITMTLVCLASATIALIDPFTISNLRGMLGITFTPSSLLATIMLGGFVLTLSSVYVAYLLLKSSPKALITP